MKNSVVKFICVVSFFICSGMLLSQNSLNFDGIDDYVSIPNGGALNNLQTGTIEMWVNWNSTNQDQDSSNYYAYGAIVARQNNNVVSNQIIALNNSNPAVAKIIWRPYNVSTIVLTSVSSPMVNTWVHIAIVYTSGSHKMYINGNLEAESYATGTIANNSVPLTIGAWIDHGDSYSKSNIDDFRIWNVERTATEIAENMNKELTGNEANLITYYNFNQGIANGNNSSETVLIDSSINNFDGTLIGFALNGTTSNWTLGMDFGALSINTNKTSDLNLFISDNTLHLKNTQNLNKIKTIEVYNLLGQKVFETSDIQEVISLHPLQQGIHILKVETLNTNQSLKFIIN
ncbi:LamG-like jellyroll fold domain-containing protein [Lutibacter sp.]|uniref:LamG-like jellyroll fold domain-containing protein n=1 Tax=Lutibacter sp. TaxID=1925666 RepID=UPI0035677CE9